MTVQNYPPEARTDRGGEVGGWMATYTGGWIYPLNPNPDHVNIEDIAHHLSNQCRFTGAVRKFYSTGQHSILASYIVPPDDAMWALVHDSPEAYLSDIARPIKHNKDFVEFGEYYRKCERRLMDAICEHFGLPLEEPESVEIADKMLLRAEQRDLMPNDPSDGPIYEPEIVPWEPEFTEKMFLSRYAHLLGQPIYRR